MHIQQTGQDQIGNTMYWVVNGEDKFNNQTEAHAWTRKWKMTTGCSLMLHGDDPIIIEMSVRDDAKYRYFLKGSDLFFKPYREWWCFKTADRSLSIRKF